MKSAVKNSPIKIKTVSIGYENIRYINPTGIAQSITPIITVIIVTVIEVFLGWLPNFINRGFLIVLKFLQK